LINKNELYSFLCKVSYELTTSPMTAKHKHGIVMRTGSPSFRWFTDREGPKAIAPERWTKRQSSSGKLFAYWQLSEYDLINLSWCLSNTVYLRRQALVAKRQQRRWMGSRRQRSQW
jgi:hypothetical protein